MELIDESLHSLLDFARQSQEQMLMLDEDFITSSDIKQSLVLNREQQENRLE